MSGAGRKNKYDSNILPYFDKIAEWCQTMTEKQIAKRLDVSIDSWCKYKNLHPEFAELLKNSRQDLVTEIKSALIRKAKGFHYTETKDVYTSLSVTDDLYIRLSDMGMDPEDLKQIKLVRTEVTEKYSAPDVAAANLLLKNYDRDNWANDPQTLRLRERELILREKQIERDEW